MKIMVDVPDEEYESYALAITFGMGSAAIRRILNGTPLPKGHGDLIDRNELEECKEIMNTITGESKYAVRMDDIRNMPTIIEADKEGAEE